jgi:hypothetical protein
MAEKYACLFLKKMRLGFLVFLFSVFSCTTTNVFDESISPEETATLKIDPAWTIKGYNGISVNLKKSFGYTMYTIPAGETELLMDLRSALINDTYYFAKDVSVTFTFEAGKEYLIRFWLHPEKDVVSSGVFSDELYPSLIIEEGENKVAIRLYKIE